MTTCQPRLLMRPAVSISSSFGVKSTSRLTKLKRTPRTPAACRSCSSLSVTLRLTVATPRALPPDVRHASAIARLSAPWQVACTMTLRAKPRWSRSAKSCALLASHGVYLRSGAYGNCAPGPNTWQCASTLPGGSWNRGLLGSAVQSSQPGVFSNATSGPLCLQVGEHAVGLDTPIRAARKPRRTLDAEQPRVGQVGHPGLALGRACSAPWLEAGFAHRDRDLAHLLAAATTMLDHALKEVGALLLPVDAGERLLQRRDHGVFHAVVARRGEGFDRHRLEAFDHHAAAHLGGRRNSETLARDLRRKAEVAQQRQQRRCVGAAEQQRHLDAVRWHRGHHRAFDITATGGIDGFGRADLGARRRRVEVEKEAAARQRWRARLRHRHRLARGDRADDQL